MPVKKQAQGGEILAASGAEWVKSFAADGTQISGQSGYTRTPGQAPGASGGGGGSGYTYIRLHITDNGRDANYTSSKEVYLYEESPGVTNVATSATCTITDDYGNPYQASNLNDGDLGTFALSHNRNSWPVYWQFEFASPVEIAEYAIAEPGGSAYDRAPKDWTLEGSNDGTNWTVLDTQTGQDWIGGTGTVTYTI